MAQQKNDGFSVKTTARSPQSMVICGQPRGPLHDPSSQALAIVHWL